MTEYAYDKITDPVYRHKLIDVPNIIADWLAPVGGLSDKTILDFGCGEATMALGMALLHSPKRVVGTEIHGEINRCLPDAQMHLGLNTLPSNLELIRTGESSSLRELGPFDIVYSWSVFEHVGQDLIAGCMATLFDALHPGGYMFLQTTPLYYSAWGAHMRPQIPRPWVHLELQRSRLYDELRSQFPSPQDADHLIWVYETLNRATANQLLSAATSAGFEIVNRYVTYDDDEIPGQLLEIYTEDALRTAQLVFLARRPAS